MEENRKTQRKFSFQILCLFLVRKGLPQSLLVRKCTERHDRERRKNQDFPPCWSFPMQTRRKLVLLFLPILLPLDFLLLLPFFLFSSGGDSLVLECQVAGLRGGRTWENEPVFGTECTSFSLECVCPRHPLHNLLQCCQLLMSVRCLDLFFQEK